MGMTEIISEPFDWNDNMAEIAQEDFSMIRNSLAWKSLSCRLSYGAATSIGLALAKLELLEKQGCKVEESEGQEMTDGCEYCALEENGDIPENTKDLFREKIGEYTIHIGNSGENDFGLLAMVRNEEIYYKKLGFKYCPMCGRRL